MLRILTLASAHLRGRGRFVRYVLSGGIATAVNLLAVWLSRQVADYPVAVSIGAIAGTATSYLLGKVFVFNAAKRRFDHAEIIRFLLVHAVVCAQIWVVSVALERWVLPVSLSISIREAIASVIGVGSVVFTGFFLHRRVTFRAVS
jgi:putative flippase GtrA